MRIENTPLQTSGASPIDKLRRPDSSVDTPMVDLDLSFMDLLSSIVADSTLNMPQAPTTEKAPEKPKAPSSTTKKDPEPPAKLTLIARATKTASDETTADSVDHDMVMLKDALTPTDIQYMKQVVIPGLPILMGSVPTNSIFPTGEDGEISYRGFEISPKLAELIEKGYQSGRPIRVELDTESAVVLKIRNGQVSAQFVSSDKNASTMMQQGLDDLRNRLLARNLPVGQLEYQYRDPGQPKQQDEPEDSPDLDDTNA